MPRLAPLSAFFLAAIGWLVLLTVAWTYVGKWTSHPAAALTHMALEFGAGDWVRSVRKSPGLIEVDTRLAIVLPNAPKGAVAEVVVEAEPAHYAYGLPILLALLLAAHGRNRVGRALAGYALLLPAQAFSLSFDLLKQMAMAVPGGAPALGIAQWQLESIAFGYQFGALVVPTLAPVLIWLWLDRAFFVGGIANGPRRRSAAAADAG